MIIVYTKPNCSGCHATKTWAKAKGINIKEVDISSDDTLREEALSTGFTQLPIVTVKDDDGEIIASWSGFHPHRLEAAA